MPQSKPTQLQNLRASALSVGSSRAALVVHSVDENGAYVSPGAGSTQVSIKEILSSSGGSLIDSSNVSLGVTIRAGSAAGTEYTDGDVDASVSGQAILFDNSSNTLRPVTISRGLPVNIVAGSASSTETTVRQSTYTDFNTLSRLADRDQSTQVANVTNTTPASTAYGLVVREAVPQSTVTTVSTGSVRVHQSSAADLNVTVAGYSTIATISTGSVRVHQSSAADLNVTVAGYSTIATVSTGSVRVHQSTAADLQGTFRVNTSSGGGVEGSTTTPVNGVLGLHVRQVFPTLQSTSVQVTSTNSTAFYQLLPAAGAGLKTKVFAYFVGSTHTNGSTLEFMSGTSATRWHVNFGSGSSGITGANLAVTPPNFLFATDANTTLNGRVGGNSSAASTIVYRVSLAYFTEA